MTSSPLTAPVQMTPEAAAEFLSGAIKRNNLDAIHTLLFTDKVDPDVMKDGSPMLHIAAQYKNDRAISWLLQAGANVHQIDKEGRSALRIAIKVADVVSVKKLLEAGADPTATSREVGKEGVFEDAQVAAYYGADVSAAVGKAVDKFRVNRTAREQDIGWLETLLERGQPPDTIDRFGKTALFTVVEADYEPAVELMLQYHADPNRRMKDGSTSMHAAAAGTNPALIEMLYNGGGKMNIQTPSGETPLQVAEKKGNRVMIDAVRKYLLLEEMNFAARASTLTEEVTAPPMAKFKKMKAPAV